MSYRPQYVFSTPPGFRDEQFHYFFDSSNVPVLGLAIPAGGRLDNVVLQLQNDAEFILRAVKASVSNLNMRLRDPFGNDLETSEAPISNTFTGGGGAVLGRMVVPYEPEIRCPASGFLTLFLRNLTTGNVTPGSFTLYGVNRREECAA